jgi:transposase-like protein
MESPSGAPTSSLTDQGEPIPGVATAQADGNSVSRPKGVFPPLRKLTHEREREVRRLYVETTAPLGEIARRFGISQTSVARITQRHGATLRLRTATPPGGSQPTAPRSARP